MRALHAGLTDRYLESVCLFHAMFGGPVLPLEMANTRPHVKDLTVKDVDPELLHVKVGTHNGWRQRRGLRHRRGLVATSRNDVFQRSSTHDARNGGGGGGGGGGDPYESDAPFDDGYQEADFLDDDDAAAANIDNNEDGTDGGWADEEEEDENGDEFDSEEEGDTGGSGRLVLPDKFKLLSSAYNNTSLLTDVRGRSALRELVLVVSRQHAMQAAFDRAAVPVLVLARLVREVRLRECAAYLVALLSRCCRRHRRRCQHVILPLGGFPFAVDVHFVRWAFRTGRTRQCLTRP